MKTAAGAMYDIDFIASGLAVKHGIAVQGNTRERLGSLRDARALGDADFGLLEQAAEFYRVLEHAVRLATGRARKTLPVGEHARAAIEELVRRAWGRALPDGVEPELDRTRKATRTLYEHLMV
jgi:glutamine synthetase adenylyltransferase